MKFLRLLSCLGLVITLVLSSCTMQKRVYSSGYHIEWNKLKCTVNKQDFATKKNAKQKEQNKIAILQQSKNKTNHIGIIQKKQIAKSQHKKNIFIVHKLNAPNINTKSDTVIAKVNAKNKVDLNNEVKKPTYNHIAVKGFTYGMLAILSFILFVLVLSNYFVNNFGSLVVFLAPSLLILYLVFSVLAIERSVEALKQLKMDKQKGKGLAIAGLLIGLLPIVGLIIGLLIALIVKG